ncbi:PREDICTED: SPOC domain-containing protein 1 [Dipodomys ordii]|uniref:SPOC domain-containing protein 1 n=1 Tax=Dipodomys ordii TaxID=10020 RepID=A0A1S3FIT4_DIPOR|nr:PREDICTED: SPOC domain-containing protein 1 [Dipodomys ordii]
MAECCHLAAIPRYMGKHNLSHEDVAGASLVPRLKPEVQVGAPSRKGVPRKEANGGEGWDAGGAAGARRGLVELALRGSQDSRPDLKLPTLPDQGSPSTSRRSPVSLCDFLVTRCPSNLCSMAPGLQQKTVLVRVERQAGMEGINCQPGEVQDEGMGFPGDRGRNSTHSQEKSQPLSSGLAPERARKRSRKCGASSQGEEEAGSVLWLDGSPGGDGPSVGGPPQTAHLESLRGSHSPFSSNDTGDPEECEYSPNAGDQAQLGSTRSSDGSPGPCGGELCSLATQGSPQRPALGLAGPGPASTEQLEVQLMVGKEDQEGSEAQARPVCRETTATAASSSEPWSGLSSSLEAATSKACTGLVIRQRRSKCTEKLRMNTESCTQDRVTVHISQDSSEEASPGGCPTWEEVDRPPGVKHVCYLSCGDTIQLLGAIGHVRAEGELLKLEALEDFMEVSSALPTQRPRIRKATTQSPAMCQHGPMEASDKQTFQDREQDSVWLQPREMARLDIRVRDTVVRTMQEVLWSRLQEHPNLLLGGEKVEDIATGIEAALFYLTQDTSCSYKNKYRSLLFNLRDPRNPELFLKVVCGDITPHALVRMNSTQLAPHELSRWRDQEEKRSLGIIEQQQKEPYRLPASKLTHKGEVEIPRDLDQMITLEDLVEAPVLREAGPQELPAPLEGTSGQPSMDPNCHTCPDGESSLPNTTMSREDPGFKRSPTSDPTCSPEVPKAREMLTTEPQNRLQMPDGPPKAPPSPPPWEGALDMYSIKRFRVKAQLVSGHSCQLVQALPEVIHSAGCLSPNIVWDLLASICPARAKDICVVRLCPRGTRDVENCHSLYSYLNNKQHHGLAAVEHVGVVLLPLPAFQPLPTRLRSLGGPGLEATHSSLLLAVLLPKEGLPDRAKSSLVLGKVRKKVSFNSKVEARCYQPEDKRWSALKGFPPPEDTPKQSQAQGSWAPTWQRLPRGRGRPWVDPKTWQGLGQGKQPPECGSCQLQHPYSAIPVVRGFGHDQHMHSTSCLHQDMLQNLEALVTMRNQLQASLWPEDCTALPTPSTASVQPPAVSGSLGYLYQPPGLDSGPSLDPTDAGSLP